MANSSSGSGKGTRGSGAQSNVSSEIQLKLLKYLKGIEEISPKDVFVEAVCRKTTKGGVDKLKKSFLEVGFQPGYHISVNLSSRDDRFRYAVIDGSHRILALQELGKQFPDSSWASVKVACAVYENLPVDLMLLASEEANKASQIHVATSAADGLYFMHQVITKILPVAPSEARLQTRGRRGGSRLNGAHVQEYLASLGFVSLGKNKFYLFFNGYFTMNGKVFDLFQELSGRSLQFSGFFNSVNLKKLFNFLEKKTEISKLACLRRLYIYLADKSDIGVPVVSPEEVLELCSQRADRAEAQIVAYLEEVNKLISPSGEVITLDNLDTKEFNYCDKVLNTWTFDETLAQSVVRNEGLKGDFGKMLEARRNLMKAMEERAQLAARTSTAACSDEAPEHRLIQASLGGSDDLIPELGSGLGENSGGDDSGDGDGGGGEVEEEDASGRQKNAQKKRKKAGRGKQKPIAKKRQKRIVEADEVIREETTVAADQEEAKFHPPLEMPVADKLKILETYSGNFVCSDTFPLGLTADLVILHDQAINSEARAALITSAAQALTESGTLVVMCEFFSAAEWRGDLESIGKLIVEPAPLVVVASPPKTSTDTTNPVAFQHSVTRFALIAHKSLQPKITYLSSETKKYHRNPLMKRQQLTQVDNGNVITNYNDPANHNFVLVKTENEVHIDFYRFLIERYTNQHDTVVCFPMGTGFCGCAALYEQRKFYGADPIQHYVDEAILRAFKVKTTTTDFGVDGNTDAIDTLPSEADVTILCPPQYRDRRKEEFTIDMAQEEARHFGLEIKQSLIRGAGNGLYATAAIPKGHVICYYWGEALFLSPSGDYDQAQYNNESEDTIRFITTGKKQLKTDLKFWKLVINGSLGCAATYVNDPKDTEVSANASLDEGIFDKNTPLPGEVTSPPLYSLVLLRATRSIKKGEEIYASYGQNYCW